MILWMTQAGFPSPRNEIKKDDGLIAEKFKTPLQSDRTLGWMKLVFQLVQRP